MSSMNRSQSFDHTPLLGKPKRSSSFSSNKRLSKKLNVSKEEVPKKSKKTQEELQLKIISLISSNKKKDQKKAVQLMKSDEFDISKVPTLFNLAVIHNCPNALRLYVGLNCIPNIQKWMALLKHSLDHGFKEIASILFECSTTYIGQLNAELLASDVKKYLD